MPLLPPQHLDTVVALGTPMPGGDVQYSATGFLYGVPAGTGDDRYRIFLVTNRHVVEGTTRLKARLNRSGGSDAQTYDVELSRDGEELWTGHPTCDIAVIGINAQMLQDAGIEFHWFRGTEQLTLAQARELEISEGDGVYVLGFPLGLAGIQRNYTIVRQGVIARVRDWLGETGKTILIDASVFPGNSGGPVITKPENFSIEGTKHNNRALLMGMVSSYLTYDDVAISQQTGRQRVVFQENSGLAEVVPIDVIHETVTTANEKVLAGREARAVQSEVPTESGPEE